MTISTRIYNDQAVAAVNRLTADLQKIQGQISTGKTTSRASDNPMAAVNASFVRDQKQMLDRFETNIERSRNNLVLTEVTLQDSVNILKRAYELTIQADNDVLTPTDRRAIGLEITQLKEALIGLANTRDYNGDYLFSGYRVTTRPFVENAHGNVEFHGDRGSHQVQISETLRAMTGLDGADVFMRVTTPSGTQDAFATLTAIEQKLLKGEKHSTGVEEVRLAIEHFTNQQTIVGAEINKVDFQKDVIGNRQQLLAENLSGFEDADIAALVTELQSKILNRDASQQAFIKISQQSLFDYLR